MYDNTEDIHAYMYVCLTGPSPYREGCSIALMPIGFQGIYSTYYPTTPWGMWDVLKYHLGGRPLFYSYKPRTLANVHCNIVNAVTCGLGYKLRRRHSLRRGIRQLKTSILLWHMLLKQDIQEVTVWMVDVAPILVSSTVLHVSRATGGNAYTSLLDENRKSLWKDAKW